MKFLLCGIAVLCLICLPAVMLSRGFDGMEREQRQQEADWLNFSMVHHCRIVREPTFGEPSATWRCDGNFEVRR